MLTIPTSLSVNSGDYHCMSIYIPGLSDVSLYQDKTSQFLHLLSHPSFYSAPPLLTLKSVRIVDVYTHTHTLLNNL